MPDNVHFVVNVADDDCDIRYHDYRSVVGAPLCDDVVGVPLRGHPQRDAPTLFDFMHRFKSLTTARYRHGVQERGWRRFEGKVWQREYYEHIVRSAADLERIRKYIRDNPRSVNLQRFGALRYYGNRKLLKLRKTAFLASRSNDNNLVGAPTEACPDEIANAQCVISGFLSPRERAVLRYCRTHNIPTIHVSCRGAHGGTPRLNAERAAWCNQYTLENADEIVIGYLNSGGMLAFLLAEISSDTPVIIISQGAANG